MRAGIFLTLLVAIGRTVFGLKMVNDDYECDVQEFTCGIKQVDHPERDKNYTGPAYPGQWPWYATVNVLTDEVFVEFKCGAVLISEKHVLTPKLCVTDETGSMIRSDQFLIRVGTHKQHVFNFGFARHRKVSKIHQPVDFDKNSANKVVILEMSEAVRFNKYVVPACISELNDRNIHTTKAIGWGVEDGNEHLGTIYYKNKKYLCDRDRGSSFHEFNYVHGKWLIVTFVDCESEDNIYVQNYLPFIINVTNLIYYQFIRMGKSFDPSQKYPNLLPERNCGHPLVKHSSLQRSNARMYEFPWMVRVYAYLFAYDIWGLQCLGSLLNYRYVLGGHCWMAPSFKKIKVRLGEYDLTQNPDCSFEDKSDCSLPFREYDVEYVTKYDDIIHLLRTTKDIRFEDHIQPVCLPVFPKLRRLAPSEYIVTSWDFENKQFSILQKRSVTASDNVSECLQQTEDSVRSEADLCIPKVNVQRLRHNGAHLGQYVFHDGIVRYVQFGFLGHNSLNISFYMDWILANIEE